MKNIEDYELSNSATGYDYSAIVRDYMKEHLGEYGKKAMKELMSFGGGALNPGRIIKALREAEE